MRKQVLVGLFCMGAAGVALAQMNPVGLWKTIDDRSGREKALVRVVELDGELSGRIEKIFDPAKVNNRCTKCTDDRKDQPELGMEVIRHVKQNAYNNEMWDGGEIVDPTTGSEYRVKMTPIEGGSKLEVRGYLGVSLFGRTQTWLRVE